MGYEYLCELESELTSSTIEELKKSILSRPEWEHVPFEGADVNTLHLRFADLPVHADWPENIVITMSERKIYVLFHSGDGARQHHFLSVVRSLLASRNVFCRFHEM